jgi:hypothetical protein
VIALADENSDGFLDADELDHALLDETIRWTLIKLGIPQSATGEAIIQMVDKSGKGTVNFNTLGEYLAQLNNAIQIRDYTRLSARVSSVHMRTTTFRRRLFDVANRIGDCRFKIQGGFENIDLWLNGQGGRTIELTARAEAKRVPEPPKVTWLEQRQHRATIARKALTTQLEHEATQALFTLQRFIPVQPKSFRHVQPSQPPPMLNIPGTIAADEAAVLSKMETQEEPLDLYDVSGAAGLRRARDLKSELRTLV